MSVLQKSVFVVLILIALFVLWAAVKDVRADQHQFNFAILAGIVYGYGAIEGSRRLALRVGRKAPPTGRDPAELQH